MKFVGLNSATAWAWVKPAGVKGGGVAIRYRLIVR